MMLYPSHEESRQRGEKTGPAMFLKEARGTAGDDSDHAYDLATNMADGCPIIRSEKTGRTVIFNWHELIELARAAGIDASEPVATKGAEHALSVRRNEEQPVDLSVTRHGESAACRE